MKKYWKLITIVGITVLCLGIFYVNAFTVSKQYPNFKVNAVSGDNKIIEDIILNGEIHLDGYWYSIESFQLTDDGTSYLMDEPYFTRLNHLYPPYQIERLQKEHRNFMRGKTEEPSLYFENDEVLAYANTITESGWNYYNNLFDIDVINKQTKERSSTVIEIPNRNDFDYLEVEAVRVIGEEVYILTESNQYNADDRITSYNQFTYNLADEKLSNREIDKIVMPDGDYNSYMEVIPSYSNPNEVVFASFQIEYVQMNNDDEDFPEELTVQKLMHYDLEKQEGKEITLTEQLGIPLVVYESSLFFANVKSDGMTIYKYSMETNQIENEINIPVVKVYDELIYSSIGQVSEEGILYINPSYSGPGSPLFAIDLVTMELAFEGEINVNHVSEDENDMWINFTDLEIRQ